MPPQRGTTIGEGESPAVVYAVKAMRETEPGEMRELPHAGRPVQYTTLEPDFKRRQRRYPPP